MQKLTRKIAKQLYFTLISVNFKALKSGSVSAYFYWIRIIRIGALGLKGDRILWVRIEILNINQNTYSEIQQYINFQGSVDSKYQQPFIAKILIYLH